jgi:PilZ domain
VPIACQAVRLSSFTLVGHQLLDLSCEGAQIAAYGDAQLGDEILISFQVGDLGLWFDIDATVARVCGGRREDDLGPSFGLAFETPSALFRQVLRGSMLRYRPAPATKRAEWLVSERVRAWGRGAIKARSVGTEPGQVFTRRTTDGLVLGQGGAR